MYQMLIHKPYYSDDRYCESSSEVMDWYTFESKEDALAKAIDSLDAYNAKIEKQRHPDNPMTCYVLYIDEEYRYDEDQPRQIIARDEWKKEDPQIAPELARRKLTRVAEWEKQEEKKRIDQAKREKEQAERRLAELKIKYPNL